MKPATRRSTVSSASVAVTTGKIATIRMLSNP
jgi:hypothetical protein